MEQPPPNEALETNEELTTEKPAETSAEPQSSPPKKPPALTIQIQSWATPVVGIIALLLGLLGGFFIRPMIAKEPEPAAQTPAPTVAAQSQDQAAQRAAMMEQLVSQTRHFKGSADAPVTIIEFSDYQ
jgi:hypothetical protein